MRQAMQKMCTKWSKCSLKKRFLTIEEMNARSSHLRYHYTQRKRCANIPFADSDIWFLDSNYTRPRQSSGLIRITYIVSSGTHMLVIKAKDLFIVIYSYTILWSDSLFGFHYFHYCGCDAGTFNFSVSYYLICSVKFAFHWIVYTI